MSPQEFHAWAEFYKLHPFDDLHRYHRPAAMVSASMGGGDVSERVDWLENSRRPHEYSSADMNTLKAFGFKPPKG